MVKLNSQLFDRISKCPWQFIHSFIHLFKIRQHGP